MKKVSDIAPEVLKKVREGVAIPAQVLALDEKRQFAPRYQRALTRYFIDCGVGGIAVGVHSTQFAIRDPRVGLFEPVLRETSRFIDEPTGGSSGEYWAMGETLTQRRRVREEGLRIVNRFY